MDKTQEDTRPWSMLSDAARTKIYRWATNLSFESGQGELHEIRKWYQEVFRDSFDIHCGECCGRAFNRILATFPELRAEQAAKKR